MSSTRIRIFTTLSPLLHLVLLASMFTKMVVSQQTVTLHFNSQLLQINSVFQLDRVGEETNSSIQCLTSRTDCCDSTVTGSVGTGNWFLPSGDVLTSLTKTATGVDFYRDRNPGGIDLRRRNSATSPEGVYRCTIPKTGTSGSVDMVYIGLYLEGNGEYQKKRLCYLSRIPYQTLCREHLSILRYYFSILMANVYI